jgi:hypothetical protein
MRTAGSAGWNRELLADEFVARRVKTGGRLLKHARYYWLLLAGSHLNRRRFGAMLRSIAMLPEQRIGRNHD